MFDGIGPFWGNLLGRDILDLPRKGRARTCSRFAERRQVENHAKGSFTCWQMSGAGAVGSQVMMGLPVLHRLRQAFAGDISVWPFEGATAPIVIAEIWPSLFAGTAPEGMIKDAHQVQSLAAYLAGMDPKVLGALMAVSAPEEGWILGLAPPKAIQPPPLRNDCFAMPQGATWTPVDDALAHLRAHIELRNRRQTMQVAKAAGRVLATDVTAVRAHPPTPNSAVDGYGFAGPCACGRAAVYLAGRAGRSG